VSEVSVNAAPPQWYAVNGWDEADSPLTPGAAVAWESALDVGLDGLVALGEHSDLFAALPTRFVRRYDRAFLERFVTALRRVYEASIANADPPVCVCTADEVALEVLVQLATPLAVAMLEMNADTPGAFAFASPSDELSLSEFHDLLVADSDVLFLWDWEDDGIEGDEQFMKIAGVGEALKFENWFVPFQDL
jgi:hypothetical protein